MWNTSPQCFGQQCRGDNLNNIGLLLLNGHKNYMVKPPLPKISHILFRRHRKFKLILTRKLPPCWLPLTGLEVAVQAAGGVWRESHLYSYPPEHHVDCINKIYVARYTQEWTSAINVMAVSNYFLIRFKPHFKRKHMPANLARCYCWRFHRTLEWIYYCFVKWT